MKSRAIVNPDRELWRLAGLLARVQQYGKAEQWKGINDALIFATEAKAGLTVLTRNISDFDQMRQPAPQEQVLTTIPN